VHPFRYFFDQEGLFPSMECGLVVGAIVSPEAVTGGDGSEAGVYAPPVPQFGTQTKSLDAPSLQLINKAPGLLFRPAGRHEAGHVPKICPVGKVFVLAVQMLSLWSSSGFRTMNHLIVCREFPPAPFPPGGIGTYARHMAALLADAGEMVHVIAQRWQGASEAATTSHAGRLVIHRMALDLPAVDPADPGEATILRRLLDSDCPARAFAWQTARLAERLVSTEGIDVVEAPEWEAPLYYFQLRRAFGLGPSRTPPCLIHLHSPSEMIVRYNGWNPEFADLKALSVLEGWTVHAADALICPSRYLARSAEQMFGLAPGTVTVIPYPRGRETSVERSAEVWSRDRICYIGRLELRKGVVEWVDAAVSVARRRPTAEFEFVGSDTSPGGGLEGSVRAELLRRIPPPLRKRFRFREGQPRDALLRTLAEASVAVVPSRWDNLPYTCIEAMGSGLPVLVSPNGGMAELLSDGQNGWVARDGSPAGLADALERYLDTAPDARARMGRSAEAAVGRLCGNESVLARQMELRERLALVGAAASLRMPGAHAGPQTAGEGLGVVVTCLETPKALAGCLRCLEAQQPTARARAVVVDERFAFPADSLLEAGYAVVRVAGVSLDQARTIGAQALLSADSGLRAIVFLSESARLRPGCIKAVESAFGPGRMTGSFDSLNVPAADFLAVSTAAWRAGAYAAATYPAELVETIRQSPAPAAGTYSILAAAQRGTGGLGLDWFLAAPAREKMRAVARAAAHPGRAVRWLAAQARFWTRRAPAAG
jgi:glycosyltransferase involved in cell wall biosynthesis